MSIYEQAKPIDISQIQFDTRKLGLSIQSVEEALDPADLTSIDHASVTALFKDEDIKQLTIKPLNHSEDSFIYRMSEKKIGLITKSSIKKTTYQLDLSTLQLTVNDRKADVSTLKDFIKKLEAIGELVDKQQAVAYGQ